MQQENQEHLFGDLSFDFTAKQHIRSMASWAMTIVVVAIISYAISVFDFFRKKEVIASRYEGFDFNQVMAGGDSKISVIITILVGLLLNFFLYRFASQAKNGLDGLNQSQLNSSFNNLKIYFMILSILMIILFVIVLLLFVFTATKTVA